MSGSEKKREQESIFWRRTTPNPTQKGKRGAKESLPGDQLPPPPPPSHPVRNPTANRRGR